MEISPKLLFLLLVYSFAFGALMGGIYDFFRLLRMLLGESFLHGSQVERLYEKKIPLLKRPLKRIQFLDQKRLVRHGVVFCFDSVILMLAGIGLAILCYHFNQGRFRFFTLPVSFLGFAFYRFTIGRVTLFLGERLAFLIYVLFAVLFFTFCHPFVIFARNIAIFSKKIYIKLFFSIAKMKQKLYNRRRKNSLLKKAQKGFLYRSFFR